MKFGPVPPKKLPKQDNEKVLLLAERWQRASYAHQRWAESAKEAVDFLEGRQYTEAQIAAAKAAKRPLLKFNIIAPIVRLIIGYHRNNRTDVVFKPQDMRPDAEAIAEALTKLDREIADNCGLEYIDPEVFLDGIASGRGWFDTRLDFEHNDLGDAKTVSLSPFSVKVDPDADTYDLNESAAFMQIDRMVSMDEIEGAFGKQVADLVKPWTMGQTPLAPVSSIVLNDEAFPVRYFGQYEDADHHYWDHIHSLLGDHVDTHRKTIRLIETQHKVREPRNVVIDLETGDKKVLPEDWGQDKIQKILMHAEAVGNPCVVQRRTVERIQWTTMCADLILYDAPSMYNQYTMTGFFPYFNRGVTRGAVDDLIDAQKEKNKSRSNRVEIESKTANGGWMYREDSLDPVQEQNLKKFGSAPGVTVKWKGEVQPSQIQPSSPAMAYERLERQSDDDIRRISGVNESALGESDVANQSGVAIQARQRQAVVSVQMYMDNFRRTKQLVGMRHLDIIQNHYTEPRIYRITGEDGKLGQLAINQVLMDPASGAKRILHDVTSGRYLATVDETPTSATFAAAQFEEMMQLLEKLGPALGPSLPMFADLIIGMSSMPRKPDWIERLQQLGVGAPPPVAAPPGQPVPPGGGQPVPMQGPPQGAPPGPPQGVPVQQAPVAPNVIPMPVRA